MEAASQIPNRTQTVTVFRQAPTTIGIEPSPFINEEQVKDASVIDSIGGFALKVEFNRDGRYLLEQYTSGNQTRRMAIFSHFTDPNNPKVEIDRWLGAPRISQAITNGMLIFTPDASREEAEQVAQGLRNVSKKLGTAKEL